MNLEQQIQTVIDHSGANIGIALHHIESGTEVMINADSYYPMASVFKIPILVEGCFRLAEGSISLDERWELKNDEKNLPSGVLVFMDEGLTPTVKDLLTLMIIISDNTATDILLHRFTKEAVVKRMRQLGLDHIHIPMTVRELFEEIIPNPDPNLGLDGLETREGGIKLDRKSNRIYRLSPDNNVATPRQLTQLVKHIYEGNTPDRKWSDFALDILKLQQINARIPRFLPEDTRVAHKTGTIDGIRNDCGIIYAGKDSHVALSILVMWDEIVPEDKESRKKNLFATHQIEDAMGEIGYLAYQAFRSI